MISRYPIEAGRICNIIYGVDSYKVVVVVDYVDSKTLLVVGEQF